MTINQRIKKLYNRLKIKSKLKLLDKGKSSILKGKILQVYKMKTRKPNSALRSIIKVITTKRNFKCYGT